MANEKRLIDANKTMNSIVDLLELEWGYDGIREDVQQIFENTETVDAVEVVRCRDCKHLNVLNRKELYAHCPKTNTVFLPFDLDTREHFCSLGERKDGDE